MPWEAAWAPSVSGCQHTQPAQNKVPGGVLGPFGGNPTKIGSFSSAAKFHYSLLWWRIEMNTDFWRFLAFFACSARFGKNGDFLAAQPPKRSFDRPVRWYLRYLRARDVQSATLPLVYVTSGGSNLPVRPKKRPRVPAGRIASRGIFVPGARFLASGAFYRPMGMSPTVAFSTPPKSLVTRRSAPKNSRFAKKTKKKSPGGIELTTTRRPQQITMGSETMGLTVLLKEPPISPTS